MVRSFSSTPIDKSIFDSCVDLASRAPSAGKTQGWHLLVLEGQDTHRYWDITLPLEKRSHFSFPHLLDAPLVALVLTDHTAYLERYSEPDKARTSLSDVDSWVAPYWTIDASFATMTLLLALEDCGIGSLFFAHTEERRLKEEFGIPSHITVLGTLAIGYERDDDAQKGRSASRKRKEPGLIIHRGQW